MKAATAAAAPLIVLPVAPTSTAESAAASTPAPVAPIRAPIPAVPGQLPRIVAPRHTSVPSITRSTRIAYAATRRTTLQPRRAAAFFGLAIVAGPLALSLALPFTSRTSAPEPVTPPVSFAHAPLRTDVAIRQRIMEMSPALTFAQPPPAFPGSIRFAALTLPQTPPDLPVIAPLAHSIDLPYRAIALAITPPVQPAPDVPEIASAPLDVALPIPPTTLASSTEFAGDQCRAPVAEDAVAEAQTAPPASAAIGPALAAAALAQTQQFVVYDARYTRIAFPGGDVASLHGVCTDVVIRAYRALGIDLQRIVYDSRVGTGDTSIDHRRTETLRRFLAAAGESLPASVFAEDYLPGDIVTYHRPQNRISTAHIAIVSDRIGPSGRPMIIHNRGLGVQLEDALFVDRITGHYRYAGPREPLPPIAARAKPPAVAAIRTSSSVTVVRAAAKSPAAQKLALRYAQSAPGLVGIPATLLGTRGERLRP